jgi:hypothetical protein
MRKSAVVMPLLALVAGVVGFFLRRTEVDTVFNPVTGLASTDAPVTILLIGLSALAVVGAAVFAAAISRRYKAETEYTRAFAPRGFLYLAVSFLLGLVWLASAAWYFVEKRAAALSAMPAGFAGRVSVVDFIFTVLAALSAISVIILARGAYKGKGGSEMLLFSVIPPVFFCFWLVILYKENAANPVLLAYCYQVLAIAAATLGYYFSAGFVFGKAVTGRAIASILAAVYFCTLVIADGISQPMKLMFGVTAVNMLMNAVVFLRNLKSRAS